MADYIGSYCTICKVCDCIFDDEKAFKQHLKTYKHIVLSHGGTLDQYREMKRCRYTIDYITNKVKDIHVGNYRNCLHYKEERLKYLERALGISGMYNKKKSKKYIDPIEIIDKSSC